MLHVCHSDLRTVFLSGHQGEHLLHNIQLIIMTQRADIWKPRYTTFSEKKADTAEMIYPLCLTVCLAISLSRCVLTVEASLN